ncbi:SDR family NAD(P)-dependent oxidoreductase [Actinophytocola glycyrrhizae]|uniref:SDR family NAD(P)-dependent oxidoreductase n=1 Tax=Actinophytocola glycyrrhizae TaxID=2044873 RepID=A0ABV9S6I1_9PSEU
MKRIALVSGANQGMGKHVAKELVSDGITVYVGTRDLARGAKAAAEIGGGATALQLDVTDEVSITSAAQRIHEEAGQLDLLVNNAAISTTRTDVRDMAELRELSTASRAPIDEVRAVWEVNVFGPLAVYQVMLPLLRNSSDARIVNVTSAVGSLTTIADPAFPYHSAFEPIYAASKAALNAVTLAMLVEGRWRDAAVGRNPGVGATRRGSEGTLRDHNCVLGGRHHGRRPGCGGRRDLFLLAPGAVLRMRTPTAVRIS